MPSNKRFQLSVASVRGRASEVFEELKNPTESTEEDWNGVKLAQHEESHDQCLNEGQVAA